MSSPAEQPACKTFCSRANSSIMLAPAMNGLVTSSYSTEHVPPGEASQPILSVEPNKRTEVHVTFEPIYIHTAKCDRCDKHNTAVIQRCDICSLQICKACMYSGSKNDGKHWLDEGSDNWRVNISSTSAPRRSQRKSRATTKTKTSINSTAAGPGATRIVKQRPISKSKLRTGPAASSLERIATAQILKEPRDLEVENSLPVPELQMEQDCVENGHDVDIPQLPPRRTSSLIPTRDIRSGKEIDVASTTMSHSSDAVDHLDTGMDIGGAATAATEDNVQIQQQQATDSNLTGGQIELLLKHFTRISATDISYASSDQTLAQFLREQRFHEAQEMLFCSLHLLEMRRQP